MPKPILGDLIDRLSLARSDEERLAVLGVFLQTNHREITNLLLPREVYTISTSVDVDKDGPKELLSHLNSATSEDELLRSIVRLAALLDRRLASLHEPDAYRNLPQPEVCWGPFEPLGASGPILLLTWLRATTLPIDRQSLVPRTIAHHRVLTSPPGRLHWDARLLGDTQPPSARTVLRSLLSLRLNRDWVV